MDNSASSNVQGRRDGGDGDDDSGDGRIGGNHSIRYITEVRPVDVLTGNWLGKEVTLQLHPGNVEFKRLILAWAAKYRDSDVKGEITKRIAASISNNNGRFLRRIVNLKEAKQLGVPEGVTAWVQMNDRAVQHKIQAALRNKQTNSNPNVITEFGSCDVLCTGDNSEYHHPGNLQFRNLVSSHKARYHISTIYGKSEIVESIATSVSKSDGRFLRPVGTGQESEQLGVEEGVKAWLLMDQSTVRKKIRDALNNKKADESPTVVTDPRPFDVLQAGGLKHPGNVRYREAVASFKTEYWQTKCILRRKQICDSIAACVSSCNGRFLRKLEWAEAKKLGVPHGAHVLVNDIAVARKIHQALYYDKGDKTPSGTLREAENRSNPYPDNVDLEVDSTLPGSDRARSQVKETDASAPTLQGQVSPHSTLARKKGPPAATTDPVSVSNSTGTHSRGINRADDPRIEPLVLPAAVGHALQRGNEASLDKSHPLESGTGGNCNSNRIEPTSLSGSDGRTEAPNGGNLESGSYSFTSSADAAPNAISPFAGTTVVVVSKKRKDSPEAAAAATATTAATSAINTQLKEKRPRDSSCSISSKKDELPTSSIRVVGLSPTQAHGPVEDAMVTEPIVPPASREKAGDAMQPDSDIEMEFDSVDEHDHATLEAFDAATSPVTAQASNDGETVDLAQSSTDKPDPKSDVCTRPTGINAAEPLRDEEGMETDQVAGCNAEVGSDGVPNASHSNADNVNAASPTDEHEQAGSQQSDTHVHPSGQPGQVPLQSTKPHGEATAAASADITDPVSASKTTMTEHSRGINRADPPRAGDPISPAAAGHALQGGDDASLSSIQPQEAVPGLVGSTTDLFAGTTSDGDDDEDSEWEKEGLAYCQSKLRSIRERNSHLLTQHHTLYREIESFWNDPIMASERQPSNEAAFQSKPLVRPALPSKEADEPVMETQWYDWYATLYKQNGSLSGVIKRQQDKVDGLRQIKPVLDQGNDKAEENSKKKAQVQQQLDDLQKELEMLDEQARDDAEHLAELKKVALARLLAK